MTKKKKTFDSTENPSIKFILDSNKELKFYNSSWNKSLSQIEVFDSFYLDENLYVISIDDDPNRPSIFELSISEEIKKIKEKILSLKQESSKLSQKITNRKHSLRSNGIDKSLYKNDAKLINLLNQRDELQKQISDLENLRLSKTENQRQIYKQKINTYLSLFCDNIKLSEIKTFRTTSKAGKSAIYAASWLSVYYSSSSLNMAFSSIFRSFSASFPYFKSTKKHHFYIILTVFRTRAEPGEQNRTRAFSSILTLIADQLNL